MFIATKAAATTVSAAQTFTGTYRKKLREAADASKGPGAKAKPKKYAKPSLRVPDTFNIAHAEAKALLPQGASVWRGHPKNIWWAHMPPFPRTHASWTTCGSEGAALSVVLKVVWKQYLDLHDLPTQACRVEGLCSSSSS